MENNPIVLFIVWIIVSTYILSFIFFLCFCEYKKNKKAQKRIKEFDDDVEYEKKEVKKSNLLFLYGLLHSKKRVLKIKKVSTYMDYNSTIYSGDVLIITYEDGTRRMEKLQKYSVSGRIFIFSSPELTYYEEIKDFWWIEKGIEFDIEDFEELIYKTFKIKESEEV